MQLTSEELDGIERLLARREKVARYWRHGRWIALAGGLWLIGMAVYLYTIAMKSWWLAIPADTESARYGVTSLHVSCAMSYASTFTAAVLQFTMGAFLVASGLAHWNRGRDNLLLIKLARCFVDSQRHRPAGEQESTRQQSPNAEQTQGDEPQ